MSLSAPQPISTSGAGLRIGIAAARFNQKLVDGLIARAMEAMAAAGVELPSVNIVRVPGSHEVPWAVQALAKTGQFECLVGLGVLIAGDTNHHEMVGASVSQALQRVALETGTPVINGVIVVNSVAQAEERCVGAINRGAEFAAAAIEMAVLKRKFSR